MFGILLGYLGVCAAIFVFVFPLTVVLLEILGRWSKSRRIAPVKQSIEAMRERSQLMDVSDETWEVTGFEADPASLSVTMFMEHPITHAIKHSRKLFESRREWRLEVDSVRGWSGLAVLIR